MNSDCRCGGPCCDDKAIVTGCLYKIHAPELDCELYKVAINLVDLIDSCLNSDIGKESADGVVYRNGRDLMVKIVTESSVCFVKLAETIIDTANITTDLPNIDRFDTSETVPDISIEVLVKLAERLTTCPVPPIPPVPPPPSVEPTNPDIPQYPIEENP